MRSIRAWNAVRIASALGALLMVAVPGVAQSQQASVTGRVTAATGEPLVEARVMVVGTSTATSTNSDGRYNLRDVPMGGCRNSRHSGWLSRAKESR